MSGPSIKAFQMVKSHWYRHHRPMNPMKGSMGWRLIATMMRRPPEGVQVTTDRTLDFVVSNVGLL
jgi:hypothetical protein